MTTPDDEFEGTTRSGEWIKLAARAEQALSAAPRGSIETTLQELGDAYGVAAQTLRRLVSIKRFLDGLSPFEPDLANALEDCSVPAVEAIIRWWKWDPDGARDAARRLTDAELSVREMQTLERKARERRGPKSSDRMSQIQARNLIRKIELEMCLRHGPDYRATWANATFRPALRQMVTPRFIQELAFRGASMPGVSLVLTSSDKGARDVAVAVVHSNPERVAPGLAAQLAGLWFLEYRGLLVSTDSGQDELLDWVTRPYAAAGLEYFIPKPD